MDLQVGNIPHQLNNYEQKLRLFIKVSGQKLEQVTSNICAVATSHGKRINEEIISPRGPNKRTRQSARKRDEEVASDRAAEVILGVVEIGKEAPRLVKEL